MIDVSDPDGRIDACMKKMHAAVSAAGFNRDEFLVAICYLHFAAHSRESLRCEAERIDREIQSGFALGEIIRKVALG